jgi:glycosyltransferase 2 family protein
VTVDDDAGDAPSAPTPELGAAEATYGLQPHPERAKAPVGRAQLIALLVSSSILLALVLVVDEARTSIWEGDLTLWFNGAAEWVADGLWPIMQLGSLWGPVVVGAVAAYFYGWRRGVAVVASGFLAWTLAKVVKDFVGRGRPIVFLPDIDLRGDASEGFGFVSGHSSVAFAVATVLLPVLPRWGRVVAYGAATTVGLSRIVYGLHLPLDVVGGACLGIMCGAAVDLVLIWLTARRRESRPTAVSRSS